MRSMMFIALLVALVVAPAAAARTVIQSNTAVDAHLAGSALVWREDSTLVTRRADGRATRGALPRPWPIEIRGASPTHVVFSYARYHCYPSLPGELTRSCTTREEVHGGPAAGPFTRLGVTTGCGSDRVDPTLADLDGATAVVVEDRSVCGTDGRLQPRSSVVLVDLRTGARRTLARIGGGPSALRIAGDWVAWSRSVRGNDQIVLWRDGAIRHVVTEDQLRGDYLGPWDLQADGTLAASVLGAGYVPRLFSIRPGGRPRALGIRLPHTEAEVFVARDRVAATSARGKVVVIDLEGRRRDVAGRPPPEVLLDFDGRNGLWGRQKVLRRAVLCPDAALEQGCVARPGLDRRWLIADRIAR